ncbi:MAG: DNA polymerase III subunit alpha [Bryobacteraceae bacterium]
MSVAALHAHSWYSLLDGTLPPERLADAAHASGLPAAALTDRDTLAGAVRFYKRARQLGIHPVIGAELTLAQGASLVLLVENRRGYQNLCSLLTEAARPDNSPRQDPDPRPAGPASASPARLNPHGVTLDQLARYSQGLVCLAGARSPVAQAILRGRTGEAELKALHEIFGSSLALEINPSHDGALRLARFLVELARRRRVPLAAAADVRYLEPREWLKFDILQSMRTLTLLGQSHPAKLPPGRYHWHSPEELARHFGGLPQALRNTLRIAERCQFDFDLGDIRFPRFPCDDPVQLLRAKVRAGLERRYGPSPSQEVLQRLRRELAVIEEVGYAGYFLVFADLVEWCNARGIATLARGSAAGSLVCYLLGISNVCPFRFGLCFERFLNRERMQFSKLADIDLDLPWDRRDEVIEHVFDQYGPEHAAMIGAIHTFQSRSAIADIAKVYGIPEREARRFTEHIPRHHGDALEAVLQTPECRNLPWNEEPYRTILQIAGELDGLPRHFAMHPCGLVLSGEPLALRMPLFASSKGWPTTHYDMEDVEELGLLKMDLLGQAGLSVLRDTLSNIEANHGARPDLDRLDWNDPLTWDTISSGNARGVFHIESPAMTSLLVMTNCRDIDTLTAVESIIRPGAANEGKKLAFARRKQGLEPVEFAHPSLEPLLADTCGLMAFEEHILLVANAFAGMPWGRADLLRRALVKNRDPHLIEQLGEEFRASALALGRTPEETDRVWKMVSEFRGYMFNKAHSAAYAVEAFAGAWLKTRYPAEFLAAVLSSRRGFYAPIVYVLEALRLGARFLPPDLHLSDPRRFTVRGREIRLPLDQIRGLSQATLGLIVDHRPFHGPADFYCRVRPSRPEWLALLKSGALDCFGEPRGSLFWRLQRLEAYQTRGTNVPAPPNSPERQLRAQFPSAPAQGLIPLSASSGPTAHTLTPAPAHESASSGPPGSPGACAGAALPAFSAQLLQIPLSASSGPTAHTLTPTRAHMSANAEPGSPGACAGAAFPSAAHEGRESSAGFLKESGSCPTPNPPIPQEQPQLLEPELPPPFEPTAEDRARWEAEILGFPVSLHPLALWGRHVPWKDFLSAAELTRRQHEFYGKTVRVAGLIVADRRHPTPNGVMKFITLADWTGFLEAALFAGVYRDYGHLTVQPVIALEAVVEPFDNRRGFTLRTRKVLPLHAR